MPAVERPFSPGTIKPRMVKLGDQLLELEGASPVVGARLEADFSLPAARHSVDPLDRAALSEGLVIVSTLPNIGKHACIAQVVDLEHVTRPLAQWRIVHVSADPASYWSEVDTYHPDIESAAWTLHGASQESRVAFCAAFGVGVVGHRRIAHGLFAIEDGLFASVMIPRDQLSAPSVRQFVQALRSGGCGEASRFDRP